MLRSPSDWPILHHIQSSRSKGSWWNWLDTSWPIESIRKSNVDIECWIHCFALRPNRVVLWWAGCDFFRNFEYVLSFFELTAWLIFIHFLCSCSVALFAGVSTILIAYIFEMRRRGVIFGWTPEFARASVEEFGYFVKRYHGYLSSFGMVITFWHHPFESTFAHWTGLIHIFLLLWHSSMIYQRVHRNRYWTALLEMWILIHGSVVAYYQGILDGKAFHIYIYIYIYIYYCKPFLFFRWKYTYIHIYIFHHFCGLKHLIKL